jgi:hypothetical protein
MTSIRLLLVFNNDHGSAFNVSTNHFSENDNLNSDSDITLFSD